MALVGVVPYGSLFIDASWRDILSGIRDCTFSSPDRQLNTRRLQKIWTTAQNPNHVLPCLSVRTGLDLFLTVKKFPPGSEIIMSAINIPDMARVVRHHGVRVIPIDVHIETLSPKVELLEGLITERTVAVLVAHLYGKWFDIGEVIDIARRHGLYVLEDCAEGFCGFEYIGDPRSDIAFFSFGVIKPSTAFGGSILKIKDSELFSSMNEAYSLYPTQSSLEYLRKLLKYSVATVGLNCPFLTGHGVFVVQNVLGINHQKMWISLLRGFPDQFFQKIRQQPSAGLLSLLVHRCIGFRQKSFQVGVDKGRHADMLLQNPSMMKVGDKAHNKNYWLFPILVEKPDEVIASLCKKGINAYRGATQLNVIKPLSETSHHLSEQLTHYPEEARFIIDHVVYLPIHKRVPYYYIERVCKGLEEVLQKHGTVFQKPCFERPLVVLNGKPAPKLPSKL
ncbi:uncharacterized protein [Branchiostoma lanceolatum]|uniref:uncharacterized protein n=1 Tax=Branchiostoma lanceolatum TaxID=7740 RepID=UPI0034522C4B